MSFKFSLFLTLLVDDSSSTIPNIDHLVGVLIMEGNSARKIFKIPARKAGLTTLALQGRYFPSKTNYNKYHPVTDNLMNVLGLRHGMIFKETCGLNVNKLFLAMDGDGIGGFMAVKVLHFLYKCWSIINVSLSFLSISLLCSYLAFFFVSIILLGPTSQYTY